MDSFDYIFGLAALAYIVTSNVEKIGNYVENGSAKAKYKKRGVLI